MIPVSPRIAVLDLTSWLDELWNASSGTATLWQTTLIALCLSVLASLITHALTKRRENSKWAKQNTLQALHRATDSFYVARKHYGHIVSANQSDVLRGFLKQSSEIAAKNRDWNPLREDLQRLLGGLMDVQLSSGKYQNRVGAVEDLCRRVITKLGETMKSGRYEDPEGHKVHWGSQKTDFDYILDAQNAIYEYETAFLELREDITADLTASWRSRRQRKSEQRRDRRKESRQTKKHSDSVSSEAPEKITTS